MTKTIKEKNATLIILCTLYLTQGIMFREINSALVRVLVLSLLIIVVGLVPFCYRNHAFACSRKLVYLFAALEGLIFVSCLFNGFNSVFDGYTMLIIGLCFLLTNIIEHNVFIESYSHVMYFLSCASLFVYFGNRILPGIFSMFPVYNWRQQSMLIRNCFVGVAQVGTQNYRNFGIFYEPGMFSVFLLIALYFELFKKNTSIKRVVILCITLLTTLSTSGYICGILLAFAFVVSRNNVSTRLKRRISILFFIAIIGSVVFLVANPDKSAFLLSKLSEISFSTNNIDSLTKGSGYERWRSVVYAIEVFVSSPIIGVGQVGWLKKFTGGVIGTATPINYFGLYGIFYGCIMNWFYFRNARIIEIKGFFDVLAASIIIVEFALNIMSQNMASDMIIILLVFYGAKEFAGPRTMSTKVMNAQG